MTVIQYKIRRFATIQSDFGHIWEQEAASSSLATPTTRKATIQRRKWRLHRGFICSLCSELRSECALFVPYAAENALSCALRWMPGGGGLRVKKKPVQRVQKERIAALGAVIRSYCTIKRILWQQNAIQYHFVVLFLS